MLKNLYNLYEEVILESRVTIDSVRDVINNHYTVNLTYDNGKDDGTKDINRYCHVYNLGKTSNGNEAIRVFQVTGPNINKGDGEEKRWKTLRLDRIGKWEPTKFRARQITTSDFPIPFNPHHDYTLDFYGSPHLADFNN